MSTATIEAPAFTARSRAPFQAMSFEGSRLWRYGDDTGGAAGRKETAGDPAVPGDLWVVATELPGVEDFGATDVALVLVHEVDEESGTVRVSPVTPASDPAPAANPVLTDSLLGCSLVLWPDLVTELPVVTLTRRIGSGLDAFTLVKIRNGVATLPTVGSLTGSDAAADTEAPAAVDTEQYLGDLMAALAVQSR